MKPVPPDEETLRAFCERNHITKLSLFGSAVRGEMTESSDVDVLVEFDPDNLPTLLDVIDLESELSALFGRRVDLRTAEDLSRYFRNDVVREARPLYETD